MSELAIASTQYGDLRGTASIDGHHGSLVHEVAKRAEIPRGYWPVGLSIDISAPDYQPIVEVFAVDADVAGAGGDNIEKYAKENAEIPVFSFPAKVSLQELPALAKRFHLVVGDRLIGGRPLKILKNR